MALEAAQEAVVGGRAEAIKPHPDREPAVRTGGGSSSRSRRRRPRPGLWHNHPLCAIILSQFVAAQPCLVRGRSPAIPSFALAQPRALARKARDEFTVPLCRARHDALHQRGDEAAWWKSVNIDPVPVALALWRGTRSGATQIRRPRPRQSGK